jgi:hypothetical protein
MLTPDPAGRRTLEDIKRECILQVLRDSKWVVDGPPQADATGAMEARGRRCTMSPLDHRKMVAGVCRPIQLIEHVDARVGPSERLGCMVPGRHEHLPCIDWSA